MTLEFKTECSFANSETGHPKTRRRSPESQKPVRHLISILYALEYACFYWILSKQGVNK